MAGLRKFCGIWGKALSAFGYRLSAATTLEKAKSREPTAVSPYILVPVLQGFLDQGHELVGDGAINDAVVITQG